MKSLIIVSIVVLSFFAPSTLAVSAPQPEAPVGRAVNPGLAAELSDATFASGVVTLVGQSDPFDSITLGCSVAFTVNAMEPITGTSIPCGSVTQVIFKGGGGNDTVTAGSLSSFGMPSLTVITMFGGPGNDMLSGWSGRDVMNGGRGDDNCGLLAGSGACAGSKGIDQVTFVGDNPKALSGGILRAGPAKATTTSVEMLQLSGQGGNDVVDASQWPTSTWLYGAGGSDTIIGSPQQDNIYGGPQDDDITAGRGNDIAVLEAGVDAIAGGRGTDSIHAELLAGTTTLSDSGYALPSGSGTGTLTGFEYADVRGNTSGVVTFNASGWTHPAYFMGSAGNDTITAGSGDQTIGGYLGTDSLNGGGGTDVLYAFATSGAGDSFTLNATQLTGSWGVDTHTGFERATYAGGAGADTFNAALAPFAVNLAGNGNNDILTGGAFDDFLYGNDGNDTLTGNGGNDTIDGGAGTDACSGGLGTNAISNCP